MLTLFVKGFKGHVSTCGKQITAPSNRIGVERSYLKGIFNSITKPFLSLYMLEFI